MPAYPYATVPGRLKNLMETIRSVAVPEKADRDWLPKIGFSSANDRTMLGVLKFIGFINERGNPTELWQNYRRADHEIVLAGAIKDAYRILYRTFDSPWNLSTSELKNFFRAETESAKGTVSKMVDTFNALCKLADFRSLGKPEPDRDLIIPPLEQGSPRSPGFNVTLTFNLPENADETYFQNFFKALKENIFPGH